VVDAGGSGLARLSAGGDRSAWSPDGTQIAFLSGGEENLEIYVVNADGSNPTRLTTGGASHPAWSPAQER